MAPGRSSGSIAATNALSPSKGPGCVAVGSTVFPRYHRRRGEGTRALPPRPARLALRSPLALLLAGIFVASDAGLAANDRAGVVSTPLCRLCRYLPLKG